MTIAEKLTTIAENVPKVYAAGQQNSGIQYAARPKGLFWGAVFPEGYEMTLRMPNIIASQGIYEMFRAAKGITGLCLQIPTEEAYNARHLLYSCSSIRSLTLPEGIRFTNFESFAGNCTALEEIQGSLDLSGSSNNDNAFLNCYALREVRFVPGSIRKNIDFSKSEQLSTQTVDSILDGLGNLVGMEAQQLSLPETVKSNLTQQQYDTLMSKNWTFA